MIAAILSTNWEVDGRAKICDEVPMEVTVLDRLSLARMTSSALE